MTSQFSKTAFFVSLIFAPFFACLERGEPSAAATEPQPGRPVAELRGVVIDAETREPIKGAVVSTLPPTLDAVTDEQGRFRLEGGLEEESRYVLVATANGYAEQALPVDAEPGAAVMVHLNLEPVGAVEGEAVTSLAPRGP